MPTFLLESSSHQTLNALSESFKSTTHLGSKICIVVVVVDVYMISFVFHCLQTLFPSSSFFSVPVSTEICENVAH